MATWDVRSERVAGLSIPLGPKAKGKRAAKVVEKIVTRIQYRKAGSRGRFATFVVEGPCPENLGLLVDAYVVKLEEQRESFRRALKKAGAHRAAKLLK